MTATSSGPWYVRSKGIMRSQLAIVAGELMSEHWNISRSDAEGGGGGRGEGGRVVVVVVVEEVCAGAGWEVVAGGQVDHVGASGEAGLASVLGGEGTGQAVASGRVWAARGGPWSLAAGEGGRGSSSTPSTATKTQRRASISFFSGDISL